MNEETEHCKCLLTNDKDEYWGKWILCECGYDLNIENAKYCGGCGKKINIIGETENYSKF